MACWPGSLACQSPDETARMVDQWAGSAAPVHEMVVYALMSTLALTAPHMLHDLLVLVESEMTREKREGIFNGLVGVPKSDLAYVLARTSPYDSDFVIHVEHNDPCLRAPVASVPGAWAHAFLTRCATAVVEVVCRPQLMLNIAHAAMILVHHEKPDVVWACLAGLAMPDWIRELHAIMQRSEAHFCVELDETTRRLDALRGELAAMNTESAFLAAPTSAREHATDVFERHKQVLAEERALVRRRLQIEHIRGLFAINALLLVHRYAEVPIVPAPMGIQSGCYSDARLLEACDTPDADILREMLPWAAASALPREYVLCALEYHQKTMHLNRDSGRAMLDLHAYRDTAELDECRYAAVSAVANDGAGFWLAPCAVRGIPPQIDCRVQMFQRVPSSEYYRVLVPYAALAAAAGLNVPCAVVEHNQFVYLRFPTLPPRNMMLCRPVPDSLPPAAQYAIVWLWNAIRTRMADDVSRLRTSSDSLRKSAEATRKKVADGIIPLPLLLETQLHDCGDGAAVERVVDVHVAAMSAWYLPQPPDPAMLQSAAAWAAPILAAISR